MILREAVERAREFLERYVGLSSSFLTLDEFERKENKWIFIFEYGLFPPFKYYQVTVDDETREVISFKRITKMQGR